MLLCRHGAKGQALLLRDVHAALLRALESAEDEPLPPPATASAVAPPELGPHDAYRSENLWDPFSGLETRQTSACQFPLPGSC